MTPFVQFVLPPFAGSDNPLENMRKRLLRGVEDAGWGHSTLRSVKVPSRARGEGRRKYQVLEPHDAYTLYKRLHRRRVAVLQLAQCQVLKDPSAGPTERNVMRLERFVRYKAFFSVANLEEGAEDALERAAAWFDRTHCTGENDPRCLPLHTFDPETDWEGLASDTSTFESIYGGPAVRSDHRSRRWVKAKDLHSAEVDCVAGFDLRAGFHWDVNAARNASQIWGTREVLDLKRDGYINVYPDGSFRGGKLVRVLYEAPRPSPEIRGGPRGPTPKRNRPRR